MEQVNITPRELAQIRSLSDGMITHLLSVIDDKGWEIARILLPAMTS